MHFFYPFFAFLAFKAMTILIHLKLHNFTQKNHPTARFAYFLRFFTHKNIINLKKYTHGTNHRSTRTRNYGLTR